VLSFTVLLQISLNYSYENVAVLGDNVNAEQAVCSDYLTAEMSHQMFMGMTG